MAIVFDEKNMIFNLFIFVKWRQRYVIRHFLMRQKSNDQKRQHYIQSAHQKAQISHLLLWILPLNDTLHSTGDPSADDISDTKHDEQQYAQDNDVGTRVEDRIDQCIPRKIKNYCQ